MLKKKTWFSRLLFKIYLSSYIFFVQIPYINEYQVNFLLVLHDFGYALGVFWWKIMAYSAANNIDGWFFVKSGPINFIP